MHIVLYSGSRRRELLRACEGHSLRIAQTARARRHEIWGRIPCRRVLTNSPPEPALTRDWADLKGSVAQLDESALVTSLSSSIIIQPQVLPPRLPSPSVRVSNSPWPNATVTLFPPFCPPPSSPSFPPASRPRAFRPQFSPTLPALVLRIQLEVSWVSERSPSRPARSRRTAVARPYVLFALRILRPLVWARQGTDTQN